jgi:hypothetical protein
MVPFPCWSPYLEPVAVVCEPALDSEALRSRYYVAGKLFEERWLRAWLRGEVIPTVGNHRG